MKLNTYLPVSIKKLRSRLVAISVFSFLFFENKNHVYLLSIFCILDFENRKPNLFDSCILILDWKKIEREMCRDVKIKI